MWRKHPTFDEEIAEQVTGLIASSILCLTVWLQLSVAYLRSARLQQLH